MTSSVDTGEPGIRFSEAARSKLVEVLRGLSRGGGGSAPEDHRPQLGRLRTRADDRREGYAEPAGDAVSDYPDFRLFVEGERLEDLRGTAVNYQFKGPNVSGLEFDNPNPVWSDPLALQIQRIFDEQINPQIAAHGGYVQLLDVQGSRAYIEMGGGCQGCGMASVTLKQGVEVAVKEQIPEIEELVDVTDHASGDNPYYQPSKK